MKKINKNWLLFILLFNAFLFCFLSETNAQKNSKKDFYTNPILAGDYPDPSVIRAGKDYYMTHSSFEYYPGLLIWHSTDLFHWERLTYALHKNVGSVWAPDLVKYKDSFYIYFPAGGKIWAVTSQSPAGPWSDPVDMNLEGFIDPGHVVGKDGTRYLYLSNGNIVQLNPDGLSVAGKPQPGYKGWQFPKNWSTECFCLESPKSTVKDGYFYQTVAEGGTAGPATSHMVVSARAKSPFGPWENSPYNPIIHTQSRNEKWWSQGHGTLVDDINGNWWIMYHGYEKNFHTLGRQTLMLPIVWTKDHWFRVPDHITASDTIRKPAVSSNIRPDNLSDDFSKDKIGLQWQSFRHFPSERIHLANGKLELDAKGNSFEDSPPLLVNAGDSEYEIQVEYTIDDSVTAGLTLFYNEQANVRIAVNKDQFAVYNQQSRKISVKNELGNHGFLRILNDENEISFYYSTNGKDWVRVERTLYVAGFNHNVFGGFISLRAGIYAFGKGKVVFDNFKYTKLMN
jgi:xylan 1,4-beta-xylosidase